MTMQQGLPSTVHEVAATPPPWKYGSLNLVDTVSTSGVANYLVRGPVPVNSVDGNDYVFDYGGLTAAIEARITDLRQPYYICDISLLYDGEPARDTEEQFFAANPGLGQFVSWIMPGTDQCFFDYSDPERDEKARTIDSWLLPDRVAERVGVLRDILSQDPPPGSSALVVYVHCDGGCDRTSLPIGGYILRFLGMNWQQMYASNLACARPMGCNHYRAQQWYARYLELVYGIQIDKLGDDGGCYDGQEPDNPRIPIIHECHPTLS